MNFHCDACRQRGRFVKQSSQEWLSYCPYFH